MNIIKDRIFLGAISFILAIPIILSLFRIDNLRDDPHAYIIFFNAVIASNFFAFGWIGGALFFVLALIMALFLSLASGSPLYYLHMALFSITAILSFRYLSAFAGFQTDYILRREKIEEERNALSKRLQKDSAQVEASDRKLERFKELKNVAEHLSDILSLDETTEFLTEKSFDIVGKSQRSLVYLIDANSQELLLTHSRQPQGFPRIKTKKGDMFDKWVLRQDQPLIVLDATKDFRFPHDNILDEINFKSLIAVPMTSHDRMTGILRLDSQDPNVYNPDDLRLLDIIGDLGAVSLHNNMLYQRTTELAIRDGLTHLFVHRYFMERLTEEIQRALKKEHRLSILMIDIDHFKDYNDRYGHIAGDILLKHLADIFKSIVAKGDIVARYGGEEFAVILFDVDRKDAKKLAEEIRKSVEKEPFYLRREKTHATISIGVATLPDDAKTGEDLLRIADQNLYRAKKEGRNRICTS